MVDQTLQALVEESSEVRRLVGNFGGENSQMVISLDAEVGLYFG